MIVSAVAGLSGGAVGGVLTAGQISRRSELARHRLAAENALRGIVETFRATIVFDHDQVYEASRFSKDYASVGGQEEFAVAVLSRLHPLGKRTARVLRAEVLLLVGDLRYKLAEQRRSLPSERLDPDHETMRQSLALHRILNAGGERVDGLLPGMLATQNDPAPHGALYEQCLASLTRMLEALGGEPARR
jgi:hypothetical protein